MMADAGCERAQVIGLAYLHTCTVEMGMIQTETRRRRQSAPWLLSIGYEHDDDAPLPRRRLMPPAAADWSEAVGDSASAALG